VGTLSRRNPRAALPFAVTVLIACVAEAIVSFVYFFAAPMVMSSAAVVCAGIGAALVRRDANAV
jgi:hypothetical protein